MTLCPVCKKEDAIFHPILQVLPGLRCQKKRQSVSLPDKQVEFTTDKIKEERKTYARSIIQPYRSGELSREYLETYGTKHIKPTRQQIKNAKYVWGEDVSANFNLRKSK